MYGEYGRRLNDTVPRMPRILAGTGRAPAPQYT